MWWCVYSKPWKRMVSNGDETNLKLSVVLIRIISVAEPPTGKMLLI